MNNKSSNCDLVSDLLTEGVNTQHRYHKLIEVCINQYYLLLTHNQAILCMTVTMHAMISIINFSCVVIRLFLAQTCMMSCINLSAYSFNDKRAYQALTCLEFA